MLEVQALLGQQRFVIALLDHAPLTQHGDVVGVLYKW
jgi:hypothetical protein